MPFPRIITWQPDLWKPQQTLVIGFEKANLNSKGFGDITLKGFETVVGIERKGSFNELCTNVLTEDRRRFRYSLSKFIRTVKYPILYLDMQMGDLYGDEAPTRCMRGSERGLTPLDEQPHKMLDGLMQLCATHGITVVGPLPSTRNAKTKQAIRDRKRAADFMLRVMLAQAFPKIGSVTSEKGKILI